MMRTISWMDIFKKIIMELPKNDSILWDSSIFYFKSIIINEESRLGYMIIWEYSTKRAIKMSRLKIPKELKSVDNKNLNIEIPLDLNYEPMYP